MRAVPGSGRVLERRCVLPLIASAITTCISMPSTAARAVDTTFGYVDTAGQKSYSQVQKAWEQSADMSQRERMLAMRGAGKPTLSNGSEESARSRKRRAMAGCHDGEFREQAGLKTEAECNARVMGGDVQFILDVMDAP